MFGNLAFSGWRGGREQRTRVDLANDYWSVFLANRKVKKSTHAFPQNHLSFHTRIEKFASKLLSIMSLDANRGCFFFLFLQMKYEHRHVYVFSSLILLNDKLNVNNNKSLNDFDVVKKVVLFSI